MHLFSPLLGTTPRVSTINQAGKSVLGMLVILLLASCSSTGSQQEVYSPGSGNSASDRQQVLEQQRDLAEQRARREAEEEARRLAEAEAAAEAERQAREEARLAAERERQEAEAAQRREAERQRELAARRAAEQARMVAEQQARIEQLRAQIAANEEETENIEAANAVLRQAVAAAEELTDALSEEEEKYNNTDPETGAPREELASARLQELADRLDSLRSQAETLMAEP